MANVGKRLLFIRKSRNIERSEAATYFGITEDELKDIELYNADYDIALVLKSCKLYNTSIAFLLDENEKIYHHKSPSEDDYRKYEDNIICTDNLRNFKKKEVNFVKKPDNCKGPNSDYFVWRILESEYCLKGYVTIQNTNSLESLRVGDVIVAIVKQKPVYGVFAMIGDDIFIRPITAPHKHLSLKAKGAKIMGLVKHLDITVS